MNSGLARSTKNFFEKRVNGKGDFSPYVMRGLFGILKMPAQRPDHQRYPTTYLEKFIRSQDITVSEPQQQVKGAEDKPQAMTTWENNDTPARLGLKPRGG